MTKISVSVLGASGRMGKLLCEEIESAPDLQLAIPAGRGDDMWAAMNAAHVTVDFTNMLASADHAVIAADLEKPLVIGATGIDPASMRIIEQSAERAPIFYARNFSVGLFTLQQLTAEAAKQLPASYQTEIIETHHALKKDAPSGTAMILAETVAKARGLNKDQFIFGRKGDIGTRPKDEIGIHAIRMGAVVGDHSVYFADGGEVIELSHRVSDRRVFAIGALRAARFLIGKKPGLYGMADMMSGDSH